MKHRPLLDSLGKGSLPLNPLVSSCVNTINKMVHIYCLYSLLLQTYPFVFGRVIGSKEESSFDSLNLHIQKRCTSAHQCLNRTAIQNRIQTTRLPKPVSYSRRVGACDLGWHKHSACLLAASAFLLSMLISMLISMLRIFRMLHLKLIFPHITEFSGITGFSAELSRLRPKIIRLINHTQAVTHAYI